MLWLIVKKEILSNFANFRILTAFVVFVGLIMTSTLLSVADYNARMEDYTTRTREHKRAFNDALSQEDIFHRVWGVIYNGLYYDLKPAELSTLCRGLEEKLPSSFRARNYSGGSRFRETGKPSRSLYENPLGILYPTPDFVYIISIIASLAALSFAFDSLCGERLEGALKLMLANPVPRHKVILAKWLGGYISLAVPYFASCLGVIGVLMVSKIIGTSEELLYRIIALVVIGGIYLGLFFSLGLLISSRVRTPSASLLWCLFVWLLLTILIPRLAPVIANAAMPLPEEPRLRYTKKDWYRSIRKIDDQREPRLADMPEYTSEEEAILRRIESFNKMRASQAKFSLMLFRLSPSAIFTYIASELAGTSPTYYENVRSADEDFGNEYFRFTINRFAKMRSDVLTEADVAKDAWPEFRLSKISLRDTISAILPEVLILVISNIAVFLGGFLSFIKMDVA